MDLKMLEPAIKNKVRLVSYDKINTRGIFIKFKISWFRNDSRCPREVNRFSISKPSTVVFPSGHQSWECALKSLVKNVAKGF